MLFIILSVILSLAIAAYYFWVISPKRRINAFVKHVKASGYKVLQLPYQFMGISVMDLIDKHQRSLKAFKEELPQYDLIVGNTFRDISIVPINPIILKDIYIQTNLFPKHPFFANILKLLNGGGIAFTEGQDYKRKKRIVSSVFSYDFINQMIPAIQAQILEELSEIDKKIQNQQPIELLPSISKILSTFVVKCFFGTEINQYQIQGKPYCEYYVQVLDELGAFGQSIEHLFFGMRLYHLGLTPKSRKLKRKLDLLKNVAREITFNQLQRIKSKKQLQKNLITAFYENNMLNQDESKPDPEKYTLNEIIGDFFSFFAAGTDTTANTANLILHYLSQHSVYLKRVEDEIKDVKTKNCSKSEQLKGLKWMDAVMNESLRMNTPSAELLIRIAAQRTKAGGITIPKGTSISIMPIIFGYRIQAFQNPFQWNPERWIEDSSGKIGTSPAPYTFIPFSAGQRTCIGQYLGKVQVKLIIQKIIQKYQFKAKHPIQMKSLWLYTTIHSDFDIKQKAKPQ